jgi:phenylacetate-CoA ligase
VAPGEVGEMVVTTLKKEAAPLIRYRTRDLSRFIPGECACGVTMPRHAPILGRSDDMIIYRGVNIYPGQIADVLEQFPRLSSEYRIHLERREGRDVMAIKVERKPGVDPTGDEASAASFAAALRNSLLARASVEILEPGELPRSFAKSKRVVDDRE